MRPIDFTRGEPPQWGDLSERIARERRAFRAGTITEETFRLRLHYLGFSKSEIEIEAAQYRPAPRPVLTPDPTIKKLAG